VRRHGLGVFPFQVGSDGGCTEGVAADPSPCAEVWDASLDLTPSVDPISVIDDPQRFTHACDVGVRLTPKRYQSGEVDRKLALTLHRIWTDGTDF
jgi:hypothetical protein